MKLSPAAVFFASSDLERVSVVSTGRNRQGANQVMAARTLLVHGHQYVLYNNVAAQNHDNASEILFIKE